MTPSAPASTRMCSQNESTVFARNPNLSKPSGPNFEEVFQFGSLRYATIPPNWPMPYPSTGFCFQRCRPSCAYSTRISRPGLLVELFDAQSVASGAQEGVPVGVGPADGATTLLGVSTAFVTPSRRRAHSARLLDEYSNGAAAMTRIRPSATRTRLV